MKRVIAILCLFVLATVVASTSNVSVVHAHTGQQETTVTVNLGINYGQGTIEWHNATVVPSGEFLLNTTMRVAAVEFTNFPGFVGPGLPGAFVTCINDVCQNPAANMYWTFWVYEPQSQQYVMTQVGSGSYALTFDQTVQWYYQNAGSLTNPALQPYTTVSLSAQLDSSTDPPTAVISGSIYPPPSGPVNVTLEYSVNQGASYQEIARITSAAGGTFTYSWRLPGGGMFMVRADAQGIKSSPVSFGTSGGVPGFPFESLLAGIALGLSIGILRRKKKFGSRHSLR